MRRLWRWLLVLPVILAACGQDPQEVAQNFYEAFEHHEFSRRKVMPARCCMMNSMCGFGMSATSGSM